MCFAGDQLKMTLIKIHHIVPLGIEEKWSIGSVWRTWFNSSWRTVQQLGRIGIQLGKN